MLDWFKNLYREPSGDQVLRKQLEAAERDRADHLARAEYHEAMSKMLETRIERIRKELGYVQAD